MPVTLTQADRWVTLETPLGSDVLVATELRGREAISDLFEFRVSALTSTVTIAPADLLGATATVSFARPGGTSRKVHGMVRRFSGGPFTRDGLRLVELILVPSLWTLDRTSDYRVFQDKSVRQIAETLLTEGGIAFEFALTGTYAARDYCVQYGETDLAFLRRLFAEEGIYFFFTHAAGEHKLIVADHANAYRAGAQATLFHRPDLAGASDVVSDLDVSFGLADAEWMLRDYKFETVAAVEATRKTTVAPASSKPWQQFRFPAGSTDAATLTRRAGAALDAEEAGHQVLTGVSAAASLTPGHTFQVSEHRAADVTGAVVVTRVEHEARHSTHFPLAAGDDGKPFYRNRFAAAPATRVARPPLVWSKPVAPGPQTALVVGPAGDEVHTDEFGRIRVQFPWDRLGTKDDKSSCFVRVAQSWAGSGWGSVFVPRVGMEVVVQFLDGNPDRPLVTGAVYNGNNKPPWDPGTNKGLSGFRSRSTKQGDAATFNELSIDDTKGSEKFLLHAQKDFSRIVEHDDTLTVGHDQTRTVKNSRTVTIEEADDTLTVAKGNRTVTIKAGNHALTLSKGDRSAEITEGKDALTVAGDRSLTVKTGNHTVEVSTGNQSFTVAKGDHSTVATLGKVTIEAATSITLKCGSSEMELGPAGVTIKGLQVSVQATSKAEVKGAILSLKADGMADLKAGIVKIN